MDVDNVGPSTPAGEPSGEREVRVMYITSRTSGATVGRRGSAQDGGLSHGKTLGSCRNRLSQTRFALGNTIPQQPFSSYFAAAALHVPCPLKLIRTISAVFLELFCRFEFEFCRRGNYFKKKNRFFCVIGFQSHTTRLYMCMCCTDTQQTDTHKQHTQHGHIAFPCQLLLRPCDSC